MVNLPHRRAAEQPGAALSPTPERERSAVCKNCPGFGREKRARFGRWPGSAASATAGAAAISIARSRGVADVRLAGAAITARPVNGKRGAARSRHARRCHRRSSRAAYVRWQSTAHPIAIAPKVSPLVMVSFRKAMMLMTRLAKKPTTMAITQHKIRRRAPRLRALSLILHLQSDLNDPPAGRPFER